MIINLKNTRLFSKKLIGFLLISLIFPTFILAEEPDGVLLTGLFTDSGDTREQEILSQGVAKTFNVRLVWTYDQTDIITGPLEAFAAAKDVASSVNGLKEPLLSKISGYQRKVIAHSAAVRTAVSLAKQGKLWGDELYVVSPALISQEELRTIRDLIAQGKGFKEIVVYTGDDMIPDFKEVSINFKDYLVKGEIKEGWPEISLGGESVKLFLANYLNLVKETIGKEPISITIYSAEAGNRFVIKWEDGTVESFYLQKDTITGEDFQEEEGIKPMPLYEGFPHGRAQLEGLAKFYELYGRMPEKEDLALFKQLAEEDSNKAESVVTTARDPNEKLVSPEGDVWPQDRLNYAIKYENEGKGIAYGVYITDTLDEDLDDTTLTVENNGSYDPRTRTISWFIGEVGPGEEGSVDFSVNVKEDVPNNSEVINFATVYFPSVPEATRTNGTVNRIITFIDNIPPETSATVSPSASPTGWNNTNVTIDLTATDDIDGSGVKEIHYKLTGAVTKEETIPGQTAQIILTTEGITNISYWAIDNAGNVETQNTFTVKIDKTPPTMTTQVLPQPNSYGWNNTDVTVTFIAEDTLSGIASITEPIIVTTEGENQYIGGEAVDVAGNKATTSVTLNIDKTFPIVSINANPDILWPPNHKLVDVTISGEATDNLSDIAQTTFIVEDEYDTIEPAISDFGSTIQLEAWRNGTDLDGRAYNISVTTKDKADNESSSSTAVICPHDQRKK